MAEEGYKRVRTDGRIEEGRPVYREVRTCKQKLRRKGGGGTRRDEGRKEENERK